MSGSVASTRATCSLVVPVYNEEASVERTLAKIRAHIGQLPEYDFEIVCVNDGSTDRSGEVLAGQLGITVVTHPANRGYGAALRSGLDRSQGEWAAIVDADGTYDVTDLKRLLACTGSGADMVVGARKGVGISSNPFRRFARWLLRNMVRGLTGVMVPDLNSGLRVFRRSLYVEFRHLLPRGFSFTTTITVASLYAGYTVEYLPIEYHHRVGRSNIKPVKDFIAFTILIVRLASYFEPLSFFLPLSYSIVAIGVARGIRDVLVTNALGSLSVIMFVAALQVFVTGVIADVVVKRSQANGGRDGNGGQLGH